MKEVESMSSKELSRLVDWLKMHGMTEDEIIDCLHYIANEYRTERKNE